jgi:hypothetical protein
MATPPEGGGEDQRKGERQLTFAEMVRSDISEERGGASLHQKAWETLTPIEDEAVWTHTRWRTHQTDLLEHARERHEGGNLGNPSHPMNTQDLPTEDVNMEGGDEFGKEKPNHNNRINPFREEAGERLPEGHTRCASGYLLRPGPTMVSLDMSILGAEIQFLSDHLLIANFIGPKPKLGFLEPWLKSLNNTIKQGQVFFNHEAGFGFFYLKCDTQETTKQVLMQTPFPNDFGTCVFHPWVPVFDAANPSSLRLPTWITIKRLPLEYLQMAHLVAAEVGTVLGSDPNNSMLKNPRFCVSINVEKGWATEVELTTLTPGVLSKALIDYDSLPIRCRFCLSTGHLIRECNEIPTKRYGSHTWTRPRPDYGERQPTPREERYRPPAQRHRHGGGFREGPHFDPRDKHAAKMTGGGKPREQGQTRVHNQFRASSNEVTPATTTIPDDDDGFTLVTNRRAKGKAWVETHHHQQIKATTSTTDCTTSTHEGRGSREPGVETMTECNKSVEEPCPKEGVPNITQDGTMPEARGKEIENHEAPLIIEGAGPTNMRWSPRKVLGTKRRANATGRKNQVHDNSQENGNLAIVPFNREARPNEDLSDECVPETQNSTQSSSQPLDVITFLANGMEEERDETSPTPTFKHPRIGEVGFANEGHSTSILQHIGLIEEDDQEVFVDALDDRPTPISPTPLMIEENIVSSLTDGITPTTSSQRLKEPTRNGEDRRNLKAASVRGLKSSARRKTQQGGEEAPSFNLWRGFNRTTEEETSNHGSGTIPLPFTSTQ